MKSRRVRHVTNRRLERLEARLPLAIEFVGQAPLAESDHAGAAFVAPADVDGDGDEDLFTASSIDGRLGWYENTDGQGNFGPQRRISDDALGVLEIADADLDGDGDVDLLASLYDTNQIVWHENLDGNGNFAAAREVTNFAIGAAVVGAADFDGDDDLDVYSTSGDYYDSDVSWYENIDGKGNFGEQQIVTIDVALPFSAHAEDLDGDGDVDLMSASYLDNRIAWYENVDGKGNFGPQQLVDDQREGPSVINAADIDGDGDMDLLSATFVGYSDSVAWYENINGGGIFGPARALDDSLRGIATVRAADVDGDGDNDLIAATFYGNEIVWFRNEDGQGTFGAKQIIHAPANGATSATVADLDGDDDLDVTWSTYLSDEIAWSANADGQFLPPRQIAAFGAVGVEDVSVGDLNGDGRPDVVSTTIIDDTVGWYAARPDGGFTALQVVADASGVVDSQVVDMDGDQALDILVASASSGLIGFYRNQGNGTQFDSIEPIATLRGTRKVLGVDLDADGDTDVVSVGTLITDSRVEIFLNEQDSFTPGSLQVPDESSPEDVAVGDIDGDGDLDLVVSFLYADRVSWYRNVDGKASFEFAGDVVSNFDVPEAIALADIDGDGDLDGVGIAFLGNELAWMENRDGQGSFGPKQTIAAELEGPSTLAVADVDDDGDPDLLVGTTNDRRISFYEQHGDATFRLAASLPLLANASDLQVEDFDGDGLPDLVLAAYDTSQVLWFRNASDSSDVADLNDDGQINPSDIDRMCAALHAEEPEPRFDLDESGQVDMSDYDFLIDTLLSSTRGDANLDGIFDSSDLILVFQRGHYEDGIGGNSGWMDGDWNCDGQFDTTDLIAAFQQGNYVR